MPPDTALLNNNLIAGGAVFSLGVLTLLAGRSLLRSLIGMAVATAGLLIMLIAFDRYHGGRGGDGWGALALAMLAAQAWVLWTWNTVDERATGPHGADASSADSGAPAQPAAELESATEDTR